MAAPNSRGQWHRDQWQNLLTEDDHTRKLRARAVAFAFAKYAGRGTTAAVSLRKLEQETGATRETVLAGVRDLCEAGWLTEARPASGRRCAEYELSIPTPWSDLSSGRASRPQDQTRDTGSGRASRPQSQPVAVGFPSVAVGSDPRSGRLARPNQLSRDQVPPTPRAQVADLLALDEEDELLEHVDDWLSAAGARVPARFIAKAHERGDLLHQLQAHAARTTPAGPPLRTIRTDPDEPTGPRADPQRIRALIDQALSKSHT